MRKTLWVVSIFLLLISGCTSDESKHKEIVKTRLNDPDSALFRDVKQSRRDKEVWCGELNAKNRMGGYVGYTRYVVQTIGFEMTKPREVFVTRFLTEKDDGSEFQSAWRLFCE
jgi:hypothetical protein